MIDSLRSEKKRLAKLREHESLYLIVPAYTSLPAFLLTNLDFS